MKTSSPLTRLCRATLATLAATAFAVTRVMACDACSQAILQQMIRGTQPSAHAGEMLSILQKDGSPPGRRLLAALGAPDRSGVISSPGIRGGQPAVSAAGGRALLLAQGASPDAMEPSHPFRDIIERDNRLPLPPTSYVPPGTRPDKKFTITMTEGEVFIGNGVIYKGFMIDGTIPGPTFIMDEGDVIEFTVKNNGTVPHGVSIHAAYTQTSKYYGKIPPGESATHLWRASYPGVYMYHCAPGGHAIPMHIMFGQYGMMVVKPKKQPYMMDQIMGKKPDLELFFLQHEIYASGKEAVEGQALYTLFNGKLFRYAESPIKARPGDFVRIHYLNVGPNLIGTFHLVGIVWDYAYWQGSPAPENTFVGGQSVLAGPTDSWIVDFRVPPDEGAYLILTHAVGSADRGAIGILAAAKDAERTVMPEGSQGPRFSDVEMAQFKAKAVRTVAMFEPGSEDLANPFVPPPNQKKVRVTIKGNSYHPKVLSIPAGTTVEWINEETFTYFEAEFSGIHNIVGIEGPEPFASPFLAHAEKFTHTFNQKGEYKYMCAPHPYMRGVVRVE